MPIPFGVPKAQPDFPIVTSGFFHLPDGAVLPYRYYPPQGQFLRAVVLALHGYTDSRDGWVILAKTLNPRGIAIYAPDQSSFGATLAIAVSGRARAGWWTRRGTWR